MRAQTKSRFPLLISQKDKNFTTNETEKKRIEEKREQEEREYKQREKELFEQELQIKKEYAESLKQARQQQQEYQDWAKNVKVPEFNPPKINWDLPKREPYVVPDFTKEMRPRDPKIDEENRKNWEKWEEENKQRKERMEARKKKY